MSTPASAAPYSARWSVTGFSATAAAKRPGWRPSRYVALNPPYERPRIPTRPRVGEPLGDCPVDEAEEVGLIELAPAPAQRRAERLAVADRSAWVRGQHVEPRVRQRHHLDPRHRAVGEVGPAVDVQHEAARPAPRAPEEALDDRPAAHLRLHALGLAHVRPEPARAVPRQRAQPAVLDREDLAGLAVDAGGDRDAPAACAERVRDDLTARPAARRNHPSRSDAAGTGRGRRRASRGARRPARRAAAGTGRSGRRCLRSSH